MTRIAVALLILPSVFLFGAVERAEADIVCDLRTAGSSCSINGGLFFTDEQHPTGTGVINSFLRLQQKGWEQGYNTSARPIQTGMDSKSDSNFTRNLELAEVGTKVIGGVTYREFFLDVNEPASTDGKNWITLDQLEIFVSNTPDLNNYSPTNPNLNNDEDGSLAGAVKIYDMDTATQDAYVQLDYLLSGEGSGSSDMVFYLDSARFGDYKYVYLFSQFGDFKNKSYKYESQAGFEEWFTKLGPPSDITVIPEPGTLLLLGTGLGFAARRRLRR
ncbi:MAG TPA: PEP-CTERM sorting domain-containing protein [Vicinamibacterales bacterium]|nr:PEP-CTERM sorting domain-containing protein [Vicinamibacterales bacterium]